jgi:GGDEF domain-containing protein
MEAGWSGGDFGTLLTRQAFDFYLRLQLKRAVRSQNFMTLLMLVGQREWADVLVSGDAGMMHDVAEVIRFEVRITDAIGRADEGTLGVLLLDADFEQSRGVIGRLVSRIADQAFTTMQRLTIGAATCPTHGAEADALRQQALSRVIVNWRAGHPITLRIDS